MGFTKRHIQLEEHLDQVDVEWEALSDKVYKQIYAKLNANIDSDSKEIVSGGGMAEFVYGVANLTHINRATINSLKCLVASKGLSSHAWLTTSEGNVGLINNHRMAIMSKVNRFPIAVGIIWMAFCAIGYSNAGYGIKWVMAGVVFAFIWMLIWMIRFIRNRVRHNRAGFNGAAIQKGTLYWAAEPFVLILGTGLAFTGTLSFVRFVVSVTALDHYVEEVRAGQITLAHEFNQTSRRVGLYSIGFTDLFPDGTVRITTSRHGIFDSAGFAKSNTSPPPKRGEDSYSHLVAQWWYWRKSW